MQSKKRIKREFIVFEMDHFQRQKIIEEITEQMIDFEEASVAEKENILFELSASLYSLTVFLKQYKILNSAKKFMIKNYPALNKDWDEFKKADKPKQINDCLFGDDGGFYKCYLKNTDDCKVCNKAILESDEDE